MTEEQHQIALIDYINKKHCKIAALVVHFLNNPRNKRHGLKLKKMGLRAGLPDLGVFVARAHYHAMFLELKSENGTVSRVQREYHELLKAQNYLVRVSYRLDDSIKIIDDYLNLPQYV